MKKQYTITLTIAIIIVLTSVFLLPIDKTDNEKTSVITKEILTYYTLKDYNGNLAVFKGNSNVPEEIFNIQTNSLPAEDTKQLYEGITVSTYEELQKLIEQYTS